MLSTNSSADTSGRAGRPGVHPVRTCIVRGQRPLHAPVEAVEHLPQVAGAEVEAGDGIVEGGALVAHAQVAREQAARWAA